MLSHIKITFQSTLVMLNLSESLSKHKEYEYTNIIFRAVIHLFYCCFFLMNYMRLIIHLINIYIYIYIYIDICMYVCMYV